MLPPSPVPRRGSSTPTVGGTKRKRVRGSDRTETWTERLRDRLGRGDLEGMGDFM